MPSNHPAMGQSLRCRDGHWEWATFELRKLPEGGGFGMVAACQYGDHWLRPVSPEESAAALLVSCEMYAWPTASAAFAARDRYARQEKESYR